jgi:hypothetical protein
MEEKTRFQCLSANLSLVVAVFSSFFLAACGLPSFWIDDSDFRDNLPDKSILTYEMRWGYEAPDVRERKKHAGYRDDFLMLFPVGHLANHATKYLTSIGAMCYGLLRETEGLDNCIYGKKIKVYRGRGYFGANKSVWAEKTLLYDGRINIIYKIKSTRSIITDVIVETSDEPP